jgi:hypothetical protein
VRTKYRGVMRCSLSHVEAAQIVGYEQYRILVLVIF